MSPAGESFWGPVACPAQASLPVPMLSGFARVPPSWPTVSVPLQCRVQNPVAASKGPDLRRREMQATRSY
eukprot:1930550-Pyramimonas_sp.AAC.1